jgi:hypothetical protein
VQSAGAPLEKRFAADAELPQRQFLRERLLAGRRLQPLRPRFHSKKAHPILACISRHVFALLGGDSVGFEVRAAGSRGTRLQRRLVHGPLAALRVRRLPRRRLGRRRRNHGMGKKIVKL